MCDPARYEARRDGFELYKLHQLSLLTQAGHVSSPSCLALSFCLDFSGESPQLPPPPLSTEATLCMSEQLR